MGSSSLLVSEYADAPPLQRCGSGVGTVRVRGCVCGVWEGQSSPTTRVLW